MSGSDDRAPSMPPQPTAAHSPTEAAVCLRDVSVTYRGRFGRGEPTHALRGVSLNVERGQTLGVVGESGSGKTTAGRVVLGLVRPTSGWATVDGIPCSAVRREKRMTGRIQVVLQNPDWSLNPTLKVWRSVAEPLLISGRVPRPHRRGAVEDMLQRVGLSAELADRRPHELSGGQRQRVAIARAMITSPDVIVFDEAVTALDASVRTQVLNLIKDLQSERGFAAVFISHDLAAARYVSTHIAVFRAGTVVEAAPVQRFYATPEHPYSQALLGTLG